MVEKEVCRVNKDIREGQRAFLQRLPLLCWSFISPDRLFDNERPLEGLESYGPHSQLAKKIIESKEHNYET